MKTAGKFLFIGLIIMVSGLQGNYYPGQDQNQESNSEFAYGENDRDRYVHKQPNTAFKLYPYHNRLNRRHVT